MKGAKDLMRRATNKLFVFIILIVMILGSASSAFAFQPQSGKYVYPDSDSVARTAEIMINATGVTDTHCTFKKFEKGVYYFNFSMVSRGVRFTGETFAGITALNADGNNTVSIVYMGFDPVQGNNLSYLNSTDYAGWYAAECLYNQLNAK